MVSHTLSLSPVSVASLLPQSPAPCVLVAAAAAQQLRSATATAATAAAKLAPPTIRMTTLERRITPTAATTTKTLTLDSATEKIVANLLASKKHPVVLKERPTPLPTQPATQIVPSSCFVVL